MSSSFIDDKSLDFLKNKKIIFTGLARNIEKKICSNIENCILLGSFFETYKIIFFENDSQDKTREIISSYSDKNSNLFLIECILNENCQFNECKLYEYGLMNKNRIDRMAFYRNIYLYFIYEKYKEYDYVCIIDWDIDGIIPISGLIHSLSLPNEWSCICANGRSPIPGTFGLFDTMYDAMALCLNEYDFQQAKSNNTSFYHLLKKYLKLMYLSHKKYDDYGLIPVYSAFNGFCIYKLNDIYGLYYKYGYTCEHISLHEQLIEKKKYIYIDTFLSIYVGHQGPTHLKNFVS
jgi:hypothetical protein